MLGDVCTMAALAMAFGGLAVAAFDRDRRTGPHVDLGRARCPWLAHGRRAGSSSASRAAAGSSASACRSLGVGLAWGASRASARRAASARRRWATSVGVALVAGRSASRRWLVARHRAPSDTQGPRPVDRRDAARPPSKYPTFDFYVGAIGHALAPVERVPAVRVRPPASIAAASARTGAASASARAWRASRSLVGAAVAFVAHGYLVARDRPRRVHRPGALRGRLRHRHPRLRARRAPVDRRRPRARCSSRRSSTTTSTSCPRRRTRPSASASATFPESFKDHALNLWWVVLGGFALCAFLTWVERDAEARAVRPGELRAGPSRAARGVRRHARARLLRDSSRAPRSAGLLVFVGHADARALAAADVVDRPRHRAERVVGRRVRAARASIFGLLFACDVWLWAFGRVAAAVASRR